MSEVLNVHDAVYNTKNHELPKRFLFLWIVLDKKAPLFAGF
jgi:hypothetical protein